jgi:hypothetical protein
MKRIAPLIALLAAGLAAASFATAGRPPGKGGHDSTESTTTASGSCHPLVSTILKGTFTSGSATGFSMHVTHANRHGLKLVGDQTIAVDDKTTFRRNGPATLADFVAGDRLNVQARTCKERKGLAQPADAAPTILAKRVVGHPAKQAGSDEAGP